MAEYQIFTDSSADMTLEMVQELGLNYVPLGLHYKGQDVENPLNIDFKEFFDALRAGELVTTFAANPETWKHAVEPTLKAGQDALILAFSSGLSTTCQAAAIAADELQEAYPDRKVIVVDTLSASMGQGLLVYYACKQKEAGMGMEELAKWVEDNRPHIGHWFTVDDLMYLKRGGRVSAATAIVGTMLSIKPVLHMDDEGHLINMSKARGRKASLDALVKKAQEDGDAEALKEVCFITHGDCIEDAEYVAQKMRDTFGTKKVVINYVGVVIGAHTGPGLVALFYKGRKR